MPKRRTFRSTSRFDNPAFSPVQNLANVPGLPLADDEFQIVAECDEPSLAAERAHLANMVDVHQRVAVNAPDTRVLETLLEHLERLGGEVLSLRRDNPDQIALGLEGIHLVTVEKKILFPDAPHDLLVALPGTGLANFLQLG